MDCRETQTMLTAFHDRELPAADRARVEEHLRGCPGCAASLADLARVDRAAGVPDPGPAYWDRFNARVMDRVEREADGPRVTVLRPKGGWVRQQLRYLVPAAAAAALVVAIVQYGGMRPVSPTPTAPPESQVVKKSGDAAVGRRLPPPVITEERSAAATRVVPDRLAARSLPAGNGEASRDRASAPAAIGVPSPPVASRRAPDGQGRPGAGAGRDAADSVAPAAGAPPVPAAGGTAPGMSDARETMAGAAGTRAEQHAAGKAKSAAGMGVAKESPDDSPCGRARALAERERIPDAERAQRACLAGDLDAPSREKGLVFLAELLDRQGRFADADAVIAEVDRKFPQSRPLDLYRQQRPMVQRQPEAVPVTR